MPECGEKEALTRKRTGHVKLVTRELYAGMGIMLEGSEKERPSVVPDVS